MKNLILGALLLLSTISFGQSYKIEKTDSVSKSKGEIYSATKAFIARSWNSSQDVIQNDDREGGIIILKGIIIEEVYANKISPDPTKYVYSYTFRFLMKDNKYKVVVEDISCDRATCLTYRWPSIEITDSPTYPGYMKCSLKEEKYMALIESVKNRLNGIVLSYEESLNTKPIIEDF
jgi:hypothetical protein